MSKSLCSAIIIAAILQVIAAGDTYAENDSLITPGKRVRVTAPSVLSKPMTGKVKEFDTVLVIYNVVKTDTDQKEDTLLSTLHLDEITKLELSKGKQRLYIATGAVCGTIVGVVTALIIDSNRDKSLASGDWVCDECGAAVLAGLAVGTTIGIIASGERWKVVELERVKLGITYIGEDLPGIRVAFSF